MVLGPLELTQNRTIAHLFICILVIWSFWWKVFVKSFYISLQLSLILSLNLSFLLWSLSQISIATYFVHHHWLLHKIVYKTLIFLVNLVTHPICSTLCLLQGNWSLINSAAFFFKRIAVNFAQIVGRRNRSDIWNRLMLLMGRTNTDRPSMS